MNALALWILRRSKIVAATPPAAITTTAALITEKSAKVKVRDPKIGDVTSKIQK